MMILKNASKQFGHKMALKNVSISVTEGRHVALLGPSGCGKSTLLRIMAGLDCAFSGSCHIHGDPVRPGNGRVGIVFQDPLLFPWLTVEQNVNFSLALRSGKKISSGTVYKTIARVGLSGFEQYYPHHLSGGMAQRVALARAIVRRPQFLLLDEPFSALDAITRREMQIWLRNLAADVDLTLILVTHDIDEALLLTDRVLLMTPMPGRISVEFPVPLPYPRERADPAFQNLARRTFRILEEQSKHGAVLP